MECSSYISETIGVAIPLGLSLQVAALQIFYELEGIPLEFPPIRHHHQCSQR